MDYHSIALSGLPASGKSTLVSKLSLSLRWDARGIGEIWRQRHKEEAPHIKFDKYWANSSIEKNRKINEAFLEIVNAGKVIADTRYAHIYSYKTLKVFLTAPLTVRALRAFSNKTKVEFRDMNLPDIETLLQKREQDEVVMGQKLYGLNYDYRSPEHYDLTLDSGLMNVEQEYNEILKELEHKKSFK